MIGTAPVNVSRETEIRLRSFADLVVHWNRAINLVSARDAGAIWDRHIVDSAQLFDIAPVGVKRWLDVGSGGGFPGLVCAILAAEARPELTVTLVESDTRKAAFLREAARTCGVAPDIRSERVESLPPADYDVISARAVAPLPRLLALCQPFCHAGTVLLFPKGARHDTEIAEASAGWSFQVERIASVTDPSGVILKVTDPGPRS